jgi:2TM domain-containing protein
MTTISLDAYEDAERMLAKTEGRRGVIVHAMITVIVSIALIVVNVFLAPEFPWSAFAVAGMLTGLGFHYYFGVLHVEQNVIEHQQRVEVRAQRIG